MCTVTVLTYFLAGVAKVAGPLGWSWGTGEALRGQIAVDALRKELLGSGGPALAFALYDQVLLFAIMGVGTLILELGAPVVVFSRRLSRWWVLSVFLMHWGVFFIMGIRFRYQLCGLLFASFFELERIRTRVRFPSVRRGLASVRTHRGPPESA